MVELIKILNSTYRIVKVILFDFISIRERIKIEIVIESKQYRLQVLQFDGISGLDISSEAYAYTETAPIIIEDISEAQLERTKYKVSISDDAMSFYCQNISIKAEA